MIDCLKRNCIMIELVVGFPDLRGYPILIRFIIDIQ